MVLSVEDQLGSISGMLSELTFQGCRLDAVSGGDEAVDALVKNRYDILFLDQRFPYKGRFNDEAGEQLIADLRRGDHGPTNAAIPFAIVTADRRWVLRARVGVDGCLAVLVKTAALRSYSVALCQRAVPTWVPYDAQRSAAEEERATVTLVRYRDDNPNLGDGKTDVGFRVPTWDGGQTVVKVPVLHMPDAVLEDVERPDEAVFVKASIDMSASTKDDLAPSEFQLSTQVEEGDDLGDFGAP